MLTNIYWLLPEIFLSIVSVIIIGIGCILTKFEGKISQISKFNYLTALTFIFTAIILSNLNIDHNILICNDLLISNHNIVIIKIILLISSAIVIILPNNIYEYEFSQLILLATLGMMLLISSNDLITLYLSIELISLSLYVLATIRNNSQHSTEAGLKYFLLGALTSGLLLFGMALLYAFTGETNLINLGNIIWYTQYDNQIAFAALFIIVALLFKLAAAPFHMWLPDVYEGSPTIVTAYFAIVPKIAILFTLINLTLNTFISLQSYIIPLFISTAIASLFVGALGAINQAKIKRLISYSAILNIGWMLIAIIPLSLNSIHATFIYIFLYIVMSINIFTLLLNFNQYNYITQFSGLSRYNPVLAYTFAFTLLSIAGIPPLAGFFSKYLVLYNAVQNEFWLLTFIAIITSSISTFYYLRIIKYIFFKHSEYFYYKHLNDIIYPLTNNINLSFISSIVLGITTWIIITFFFFPDTILFTTFISINHSLI